MSLRLAIKRSLDSGSKPVTQAPLPSPSQPPSSATDVITKKERPAVRRRPRRRAIELPEITKHITNTDPSSIDEFGFVEIEGALPKDLARRIRMEASERIARHEKAATDSPKKKRQLAASADANKQSDKVEEISNALQSDVSDGLFREIETAMRGRSEAGRTMRVVFGKEGPADGGNSNYDGFVLETPKVLVTPPGSNPQLPHADDHCSSCIFCLIHLRDGQKPTRVAPYDPTKDYPTGITIACDDCRKEEQLADRDYRRGVHLTDEYWRCDDCDAPHAPYDFEGKLTGAFGELLGEDAPGLCDAYCGSGTACGAGDGILGLPTLIHRGPGNPSSAKRSRYVLFFTIRPVYKNVKRVEGIVVPYHKYNPALQIHASCILYNQFKKVKRIYEGSGCGLEGYFNTIVGAETASLMREVNDLRQENRLLRKRQATSSRPPNNG